jgi:hypothetical protein
MQSKYDPTLPIFDARPRSAVLRAATAPCFSPHSKGDLDGKVHLTVGSADTFYLDGSAHRPEATMKGLGARRDFRYVEGRGHFDLYNVGDDRWGLYKSIASEMYLLARPGSKPPPVTASPAPAPAC